jgi:mRNA interferase RelE/StbE
MKTEFLSHFFKSIDKLKSADVKSDVVNAILNVEQAKDTSEIKSIKKLSGHKFSYRIRIGEYRIGVFIENEIVEFAVVAHRKDIYKIFP